VATDRGKKMQMFARYGVREYWIVDPAAGVG
jgi:Uma2 family endonuclease